jgi:hypothetical protein
MVGLLNAPTGTKLYQRLKKENRLLKDMSGDNTDFSINFVPRMKYETLVGGYKDVLDTIYSPRLYYERIKTFLREYKPRKTAGVSQLQLSHIIGFLKSLWYLGVTNKGRRYFWRLFFTTLLKRPRQFPLSISLSVSGFHFRKVAEGYNKAILKLHGQNV